MAKPLGKNDGVYITNLSPEGFHQRLAFFNLALHFDKEYSSRQRWKPTHPLQFSDERNQSTMILFLIYSLPNREKRVGRQNSSTNPEASVHIFKSFIPVTLFLFFFRSNILLFMNMFLPLFFFLRSIFRDVWYTV